MYESPEKFIILVLPNQLKLEILHYYDLLNFLDDSPSLAPFQKELVFGNLHEIGTSKDGNERQVL